MKGLEISIVNYSEATTGEFNFRIDSNFYQKEFLYSPINKWSTKLESICTIKSGTTPAERDDTLAEGIILLKTTDIRGNVLSAENSDDFYYIDSNTAEKMLDTQLQTNDVLINIVGATTDVIGRVAFVPQNFPIANITQAMALLRLKDTHIQPAFLFSYLMGKYGHQQVRRTARPTAQYNLNLPEVRSFRIPLLSSEIQTEITQIVNIAHNTLSKSKQIYIEAENILLDALGLRDWQPPQPLTYEQSSRSAFTAGRLDAEYFHPQHTQLAEKLQDYTLGCITLGELCPNPTNGVEIRKYEDDGVPYLRVGDVQHYTVNLDTVKRVSLDDANREIEKVRLQVGNVLVSRSGSLGVIGVVEEDWMHSVISSHLIRLQIDDDAFDPYYIAVFLSSSIGLMQIVQNSNGGVQPEINQPSLKSILIPKLDKLKQQDIRKTIKRAHRMRQHAKDLLEAAKRSVEIAIEDSEDTALAYLESVQQTANE